MKMKPGEATKKKLRVLIVDDSDEIRATLTRALSRLPRVQVVGEAVDGLQAMECVRTLKPDVVTLDIRMPKMNGIEVLKAIRHEGHECLVIILSVGVEDIQRLKCLQLGAQHVFDKVTEFEKAIQVLRTL